MTLTVISGGQTGVDQAALRAAKAAGLSTGGHAPKGWLTEGGPAPWLADFGLTEATNNSYSRRTADNVRAADFVILCFAEGQDDSPGTRLTRSLCRQHGRECLEVEFYRAGGDWRTGELRALAAADSVRRLRPSVVLVAGNRESKALGIGAAVERWLGEVFASLAETPQ